MTVAIRISSLRGYSPVINLFQVIQPRPIVLLNLKDAGVLCLPRIVYALEIQANSISSCRLEVPNPGLDGFDDWNLNRRLFLLLIHARFAGFDQSHIHGCPAPLLVTAKAFESTSRTFVIDRAADSASAFCIEVRTLPASFTSPL